MPIRYAKLPILLILLVFLFLAQDSQTGLDIDTDYRIATYNDFSGGLNLFSSPPTLLPNQALNLENFLFDGLKLRARKGLSSVNTTSLGTWPVNGLILYEKPSGFRQIVACYNEKVYYCDPDSTEFTTFIADRVCTVSVTEDDSLVKASGTEQAAFTLLGYSDSIQIAINDTTHYVKHIFSDTMLYLYDAWAGATQDAAILDQPFYVNSNRPIDFDVWVNTLLIPGSEKLGQWDGDSLAGDLGDTASYKINKVALATCDPPYYQYCACVKLCVTPSFSSRDHDYNDLLGQYIVSYNDSTTDTAQYSIFNKPLEIIEQEDTIIYIYADSSWKNKGHLDETSLFKIVGGFDSEKLVYAGTWDSVVADTYHTIIKKRRMYSLYDTSQTWLRSDLDFGLHELRATASDHSISRSNIFLREDGNSNLYLYSFQDDSADHVWAKADSFEIYRKYNARLEDVPRYLAHWQDRLWLAGYSEDPSYLKYSALFLPDSFVTTYYIYVEQDDGDIITALHTLPLQDVLLVFKKKHIYAISGVGPYDWWVNDVTSNIGTASFASVVPYGQSMFWYDYTGFYTLDGLEPDKMSWAIEPIVKDSINKEYAHLIVGGYFDNHIWWSYPSGSATKNNRTVLYNLETGAWTKVDRAASVFYVGPIETDSRGVLWADPDSGKVYEYGQAYTDDGTSYSAIYESGWFDLGDTEDYLKEFEAFRTIFDKADSSLIYITYYKNYSDTAFTADTIGVDGSDVFRFYKRPIRGDNIGQRIKVKFEITRADYLLQLPLFQIQWEPVSEPLFDD